MISDQILNSPVGSLNSIKENLDFDHKSLFKITQTPSMLHYFVSFLLQKPSSKVRLSVDHEVRLEKLENQLANLLYGDDVQVSCGYSTKHIAAYFLFFIFFIFYFF